MSSQPVEIRIGWNCRSVKILLPRRLITHRCIQDVEAIGILCDDWDAAGGRAPLSCRRLPVLAESSENEQNPGDDDLRDRQTFDSPRQMDLVMGESTSTPPKLASPRRLRAKLIVLATLLIVLGILSIYYAESLSWQKLASHEAALREQYNRHPLLVYGAAFVVYTAVTGLSLPGAAPLSLAYGWFFSFWPALLLVSCASTLGATCAFLLARFLFRDPLLTRFESHLQKFNEALRQEGAYYLFTLRLIPAVPFWIINLVMGLTPIGIGTFWWVSQLGMLPGTCVYVYAGHSVPDLQTLAQRGSAGILTPQLITAFVLLGLFPLLTRYVVKRFRRLSAQRPPGGRSH